MIHEVNLPLVERMVAENPDRLGEPIYTDTGVTLPLWLDSGGEIPPGFDKCCDELKIRTFWKNKHPTRDIVIWRKKLGDLPDSPFETNVIHDEVYLII